MNVVFGYQSKVIGSHAPPTFSVKLDRIIESCGDFILTRHKVALKPLFINAVVMGRILASCCSQNFCKA